MKCVQAISFDAVGTLIHFARPVGEVYAETGRRYGLKIESDRAAARLARAMASAPRSIPAAEDDPDAFEYAWWQDIVAAVFACRADDLRLQACFAELFHYYAAADAWRIHAALPRLLQQLQAENYRLAICSNFDARLLSVLDALGLSPWFDAILIPRLTGYAKPEPGMFVAMAQALKIAPDAILHVGDHAEEDVTAAGRMGLASLQWTLPPGADANRACGRLRTAAQRL